MATKTKADTLIYGPSWKKPERYELLTAEIVLRLTLEQGEVGDYFSVFGTYLVWDTPLIQSVLKTFVVFS